jgi:hypothetical protein
LWAAASRRAQAPGQLEIGVNMSLVHERVPQHHELLLLVADLDARGQRGNRRFACKCAACSAPITDIFELVDHAFLLGVKPAHVHLPKKLPHKATEGRDAARLAVAVEPERGVLLCHGQPGDRVEVSAQDVTEKKRGRSARRTAAGCCFWSR